MVVCGAQFGSEGKGAIAAWLGAGIERPLVVRVAGPNAGHSVLDESGRKWKLRHIPTAAVTNPNADLYLAAGSVIDPHVLADEVARLERAGIRVAHRLRVDPLATTIQPGHRDREATLVDKIGSTASGVGAARADRVMRNALTVDTCPTFEFMCHLTVKSVGQARYSSYDNVLIEGAQGYGLGLHTEYYPKTTSSDCRAIDFLAMAGLSPWGWDVEVWLVARTRPIRVGGNSGPLINETTWEKLGLPEETTTVTGRVRRVGDWDSDLVKRAVAANGGPGMHLNLAVTMADHVVPRLAGRTTVVPEATSFARRIRQEVGVYPAALGTGPDTVIDMRGRP